MTEKMGEQKDPRKQPDAEAAMASAQLSRSPRVRLLLLIAGWMSLVLGIIGILLPILPTTPFILLAAACFARSSERFYLWLLNHRLFGSVIRDWRVHKSIPLRAKIIAICLIVITLGSSIAFFIPWPGAQLVAGAIGMGVIVFLIRYPTRRQD